MATKKKSSASSKGRLASGQKKAIKKPVVVRRPQVSSSNGATYDTLMIITILLLIFVYPVGIIFMWLLMKHWPVWLKVVISLPFLIAVFFTIIIVYVVGMTVHNVDFKKVQMQQQYEQNQMMQPSPTSPYTF